MTDGLHVIRIEQQDPRLGRHVSHDERSRRFAFPRAVDLPTRKFRHRVYDPSPTPSQSIGCCTGVDQAVKANTKGNRINGVVLGMGTAVKIYSRATQLDPWPGDYPPSDTGSSSLAACKAAQEMGLIERYEWLFSGVDQVLTALREHPVGVGTWWYDSLFNPDPETGLVELAGRKVGGHAWSLIGWDPKLQAFEGMCWWGRWGLNGSGVFRIRKSDLAELLADDGDCHVAYRAKA